MLPVSCFRPANSRERRRMGMKSSTLLIVACAGWLCLSSATNVARANDLDNQLRDVLQKATFTGTVGSSLPARVGRPVNPEVAHPGRLAGFGVAGGLHSAH